MMNESFAIHLFQIRFRNTVCGMHLRNVVVNVETKKKLEKLNERKGKSFKIWKNLIWRAVNIGRDECK